MFQENKAGQISRKTNNSYPLIRTRTYRVSAPIQIKYAEKIRWKIFYAFFISEAKLKLAKNQAKAMQQPEAELLLFGNYSLSSSTLSSKNKRRYSKECTKSKYLCLNVIIWLMTITMRLKLKYKSHRYDINRPRPRHGHKHTKYNMCLSITMLMYIRRCSVKKVSLKISQNSQEYTCTKSCF